MGRLSYILMFSCYTFFFFYFCIQYSAGGDDSVLSSEGDCSCECICDGEEFTSVDDFV